MAKYLPLLGATGGLAGTLAAAWVHDKILTALGMVAIGLCFALMSNAAQPGSSWRWYAGFIGAGMFVFAIVALFVIR